MNKIATLCFVMLLVVGAGCLYFQGQALQKSRADLELVNVQNTNNIHAVRCISEMGELDTYAIYIPPEVSKKGTKYLDAFANGYCASLERSYLP